MPRWNNGKYHRLSLVPEIVSVLEPLVRAETVSGNTLVRLTVGSSGFLPYSLPCAHAYLHRANAVSRVDSGTCG